MLDGFLLLFLFAQNMKTFLACFTAKKLDSSAASALKQYTFNTEKDIKVGETINSPAYQTPIQVTKVLEGPAKTFVHLKTGELTDKAESTQHFKIKVI